MTRYQNLSAEQGSSPVQQRSAFSNPINRWFRFALILVFLFGMTLRAAPLTPIVSGDAPATEVALPYSGIIELPLNEEAGSGATISIVLTSEYANAYPGCTVDAQFGANNETILIMIPDEPCLPQGVTMEMATISVIESDGSTVQAWALRVVDSVVQADEIDF